MSYYVFLGPPGSGKGTQAVFLAKKWGIGHVSTGDLVRAEIRSKTPLGQHVKEQVEAGNFVSDDLVSNLMEKTFLSRHLDQKGFILDGYPRTLSQAEWLNHFLKEKGIQLNAVIVLDLDLAEVLHRIKGRLVCPGCKHVYHKEFVQPQILSICDRCGVSLEKRADDTEDKARERYQHYLDETQPLLNYYSPIIKKLDGNGSPEVVFNRLQALLGQYDQA